MQLSELYNECLACKKCALCETRTNLVFGDGNPNAQLMFIGEAPGKNEDEQGVPFVGRAGEMLNKILIAAGVHRSDVYIANILKCRPPNNRDPLPEEQQACLEWLRAQTAVIRPKVIICLGRIAAKVIIDPDYAITKQHGTFIERAGVHITATFHPAALLRNPAYKPLAFEDIKSALQYVSAE